MRNAGATSRVVSKALNRLNVLFEQKARETRSTPHRPSADQWLALEAIIDCLDQIVTDQAEPVMYLSSLDPGIGKTTALIAYLDTLLEQQEVPHRDCGVLVATNTLEEVQRFVSDAAIPRDMLGVWTSREDLNALGRLDIQNAQVLITTHERIMRELKDCDVWAAESLYYKGQCRRLRVWDEAYLPGHPISVNVDDVLSVMKVLRSVSVDLRNSIKAAFDHIETLEDGAVYTVPDYLAEHDVSLNDMLEAANALDPFDETIKKLNEAQSEIVTSIALVSGKSVKVRQDGRYGNATVDYHEAMPADLAPMLILDASGRPGVRVLYDDMVSSRKLVRRIKSASKSYRNLTVHVWNRGGGKASWKDNSKSLTAGVVKAIMSRPDEEWLVIHHKAGRGVPDIMKELKPKLPEHVFAKVHFRNWGKHRAVNQFAHVTNIILAGTLFLRPSQYEARKRLAAGLPAVAGDFTKEDLDRFELGEYADDILQALCRGAVRKSQGDTCPPCHAYIIASVHSKIRQSLPVIFPECCVENWQPETIKLKGTAQSAFKLIEAWSKNAKSGDVLKFTDITKKLALSKTEFKDLRKWNKSFRDAVSTLCVEQWGPNVYFIGYRKQ